MADTKTLDMPILDTPVKPHVPGLKYIPPSGPHLATVVERPNADVVLFDGKCKFCRAQVEKLSRWDWRGQLAFLSLHDPLVKERWPDLTYDQLMKEMYVMRPSGKFHKGADSFRYLSRKLPSLWLAMPFLHIPFTLPIMNYFYQLIASRRYKLMGKIDECDGGTCSVHFGDKK
jgi:predicted DCC family thiol-disulfide oxidoreductase YuxK